MTVDEALKFAENQIGGEQANIDSKYLLSYILKKNFTWLKIWGDNILSNNQHVFFQQLVNRRIKGEPVAYITGEKEFWSLTLETSPLTLIPRAETELLVEKALEYLSHKSNAKVLDLGTGTGAIALAIATERKNDTIVATDFVRGVVELATRNAKKNNINNVKILQSDWFSNVTESGFDLILSNPPYVEEGDPHLSQGDLRFEPGSALISGDHGLADIRIIVDGSRTRLVNGGMLMIEHGFEQANDLKMIFQNFDYQKINVIKDLSGLDRISIGIFLN